MMPDWCCCRATPFLGVHGDYKWYYFICALYDACIYHAKNNKRSGLHYLRKPVATWLAVAPVDMQLSIHSKGNVKFFVSEYNRVKCQGLDFDPGTSLTFDISCESGGR